MITTHPLYINYLHFPLHAKYTHHPTHTRTHTHIPYLDPLNVAPAVASHLRLEGQELDTLIRSRWSRGFLGSVLQTQLLVI